MCLWLSHLLVISLVHCPMEPLLTLSRTWDSCGGPGDSVPVWGVVKGDHCVNQATLPYPPPWLRCLLDHFVVVYFI